MHKIAKSSREVYTMSEYLKGIIRCIIIGKFFVTQSHSEAVFA